MPSEQLVVACTTGLALQACYLSPVVGKIRIWKQLVERLNCLRRPFIDDHDPQRSTPIITEASFILMLRDSLALSNIVDCREELLHWVQEQPINDQNNFFALFVLALMRIGRFDQISSEDMKSLAQNTAHCVMALVEFVDAETSRPLTVEQKNNASKIRKPIEDEMSRMGAVLLKEAKNQLEILKLVQAKIAEKTSSAPKSLLK